MIECYCDDKLKILYIPISKVGNSSVKYELFIKPYILESQQKNFFDDYLLVHKTIKPQQVDWNKKKYKNYFKFTIVRDPLERFASAYRNKILTSDSGVLKRLNIKKSKLEKIKDINIFLNCINECTISRDVHFENQKTQLPKLKYVDFVGRIENMSELEQVLSEKIGKKITFPVINKSTYFKPTILNIEKFYYLYRKDYKKLKNFYAKPKINMRKYCLIYIKEKCIAIKETPLTFLYFLPILTDRSIGKIGCYIKFKNENLYLKLNKIKQICTKFFG